MRRTCLSFLLSLVRLTHPSSAEEEGEYEEELPVEEE
jgi:hypothetical protein